MGVKSPKLFSANTIQCLGWDIWDKYNITGETFIIRRILQSIDLGLDSVNHYEASQVTLHHNVPFLQDMEPTHSGQVLGLPSPPHLLLHPPCHHEVVVAAKGTDECLPTLHPKALDHMVPARVPSAEHARELPRLAASRSIEAGSSVIEFVIPRHITSLHHRVVIVILVFGSALESWAGQLQSPPPDP